MKNEFTSFISEHTAEFVITKMITNLLKSSYNSVVPIFPWMSREFGQVSKHVHRADNFYVIAVFPRRPKINSESSDITFKINHEVIEAAITGENLGVPFLAICPEAKSFWELDDSIVCRYVRLFNIEEGSFFIDETVGKLNSQVLINLIKESKLQNLDSFSEIVRAVKFSGGRRWLFGGSYKPIYFLIK